MQFLVLLQVIQELQQFLLVHGIENVEVYILYPHGKVTDFQRKQMTTTQSANVFPLAIQSDFDGCQDIVKQMFLDDEFKDREVKFIAANSINWARCMTQSVYFFLDLFRLNSTMTRVNIFYSFRKFWTCLCRVDCKRNGFTYRKSINSNSIPMMFCIKLFSIITMRKVM